jgi:hypothetical protein
MVSLRQLGARLTVSYSFLVYEKTMNFKMLNFSNIANVNRRCIDGEADVAMADGTFKNVKSLEIGDKVKTLDQYGNLIDTDVIMMLDFQNHNEECK